MFWLFGPEESDEYGYCLEDRQILWEANPELYKRLYWPDDSFIRKVDDNDELVNQCGC
jgi:hypothetical protein